MRIRWRRRKESFALVESVPTRGVFLVNQPRFLVIDSPRALDILLLKLKDLVEQRLFMFDTVDRAVLLFRDQLRRRTLLQLVKHGLLQSVLALKRRTLGK